MTNTSSDAVSSSIAPTNTIHRSFIVGMFTCRQCGSMVDDKYSQAHKDMHKFMLETVKALENHKSKIIEVVKAAGLPNNFT